MGGCVGSGGADGGGGWVADRGGDARVKVEVVTVAAGMAVAAVKLVMVAVAVAMMRWLRRWW